MANKLRQVKSAGNPPSPRPLAPRASTTPGNGLQRLVTAQFMDDQSTFDYKAPDAESPFDNEDFVAEDEKVDGVPEVWDGTADSHDIESGGSELEKTKSLASIRDPNLACEDYSPPWMITNTG